MCPAREMAMTINHQHVTDGLGILTEVLAPFVAQLLRARLSDEWWRQGVLNVLYENQRRDFPVSGEDDDLIGRLDAGTCLRLMDIHWNDIFRRRLGRDHRTWVKELISTRKKWAHTGFADWKSEDAWRALDTMSRLVEGIDTDATERLRTLARTVRFGAVGSSKPETEVGRPRSPVRRQRMSIVELSTARGETESASNQNELRESTGPRATARGVDGDGVQTIRSDGERPATIRSDASRSVPTRGSGMANATRTVRFSEAATSHTIIAGTSRTTEPRVDPSQAGPPGWLPSEIGTTMRITETLPARGAEADLYVVDDAVGARHVAKVYRYGIVPKTEVLERIRKLRARHVVGLEHYGVEGGRWWELLEYIEHANLRERLVEAGGALPQADVRRVLAQLADGLDSLHAIGLEHRDLKPENVLLRRREPIEVVIADWGIASVLDTTVHFTTAARTIRYAPPEAVGGMVANEQGAEHTVSAIERTRWDAWSIGMMAVEMVTGVHPFERASEAVVSHRLATENMEILCEHVTEPSWRRLCRGLLRRRPADRWGTAKVRRWLADPDDPELTIAEEQPVRARSGIDFDGRHFTDRRALGRALQQAGQAKAESFWKRRFANLHTWITDTLGEDMLGEALGEVNRDPDLALREQIFSCVHLLWPEAPITVDGVPLRQDTLQETARRAWGGDAGSASHLLRIVDDPLVRIAAGLDASGAIQTMHDAWERAAEDYADWHRRLADQGLAIPEWQNAESRTPDDTIEVESGSEMEIGVDRSSETQRLPMRMQAGVLGAAIGETTCATGLRSMADQMPQRWQETGASLAGTLSAGTESPAALAAAYYCALALEERRAEKARRNECWQRLRAREWVLWCYGTAAGLWVNTVFAVGVDRWFELTAEGWVYLYGATTAFFGYLGFIVGDSLEEKSMDSRWFLVPPVGEPGTAQNWKWRHLRWALGVAAVAVIGLIVGI